MRVICNHRTRYLIIMQLLCDDLPRKFVTMQLHCDKVTRSLIGNRLHGDPPGWEMFLGNRWRIVSRCLSSYVTQVAMDRLRRSFPHDSLGPSPKGRRYPAEGLLMAQLCRFEATSGYSFTILALFFWHMVFAPTFARGFNTQHI